MPHPIWQQVYEDTLAMPIGEVWAKAYDIAANGHGLEIGEATEVAEKVAQRRKQVAEAKMQWKEVKATLRKSSRPTGITERLRNEWDAGDGGPAWYE